MVVVKCGASGHNIRSRPGLNAAPVGKLALGNMVTIQEYVCPSIILLYTRSSIYANYLFHAQQNRKHEIKYWRENIEHIFKKKKKINDSLIAQKENLRKVSCKSKNA